MTGCRPALFRLLSALYVFVCQLPVASCQLPVASCQLNALAHVHDNKAVNGVLMIIMAVIAPNLLRISYRAS